METKSIVVGALHPEFILDETLISLFKSSVEKSSDAVAIQFEQTEFTYKELDVISDAFAIHLQKNGLRRGDACLIWWPRGIQLHVAILAVLKCGATYVPLDFEVPEDRVFAVMQDIQSQFLITTHSFSHPCTIIHTIGLTPDATQQLTAYETQPDDYAYVLFTSGSTGKPKGIPITHRNIAHLVRSENHLLQIQPNDIVYQGFSVSFDMWCEETWVTFASGGKLWVADAVTAKSIDELSNVLSENNITVLHAVPSLLAVMEVIPLPKLRLINAGGEACSDKVIEKWAEGRVFFNSYGPTETTVSATFARLEKGDKITIGKPLSNYGIAVVDEQLLPVPLGIQGELVISGVGVSNGYLNLDALTKEKFVVQNESLSELPGSMIYRTGDAVYMDSNFDVHFVGRLDNQVKLRGYRIELDEIENTLNSFENIQQSVVCIKKDANQQEQLTGYVILKKGTWFDESGLKEQLALTLPTYMIPFTIVELDEFPRLPSGKIDRKKLPTPTIYETIAPEEQIQIEETDTISQKVIKLLVQLFPKQDIDLSKDFFNDLGGHSLLAASFVSKIRKEAQISNASLKDIYLKRPLSNLVSEWEVKNKTERKTKTVFHKISKLRYLTCSIAQFFALLFIFGCFATEIFIPYLGYYFTLLETERHLYALVAALLIFCTLPPLLILSGVLVKWLVIGKYKAGEYPLWGSYYFRWWFVSTFQKLVATQFMNGTPLYPFYLKIMGVKIAPDAQISSITVGATDLVTIGKDVSISSGVVFDNATVEDGLLKLSKITLKEHAYVGSNSVIGGNTTIEAWGELQDQSFLEEDKIIGYGEIWKGSPAVLDVTRNEKDFILPLEVTAQKRYYYNFIYSIVLLFFPFFVLIPLMPTIVIISELDDKAGYFEFNYIWITPFLTIIYLILFAGENILLSRWIHRSIQPGTYPLYSKFYVKKWLVDQMNSLSLIVLHPIFATVFVSAYYRALGAKVGKNTEISTASNVTHPLLEIGDNSFIADAVMLGEYDVRGQRVTLEKTTIENNSFVGNSALIPQGYHLPSNMLVGVLSVPPTTSQLKGQNMANWFGSPAIALPKRQDSKLYDISQTFSPTAKVRRMRTTIEFIRIILPQTIILIGSILFIAYSSELLYYEPIWEILLTLPFYYLGFIGIPAVIFTVILKWVLIGKYKPLDAPMWSMQVWKSELITCTYEALCIPFMLEFLKGTIFLPFFLRFFGVKIGKRTFLNTADFTEFDMVTLGDDVALNEDCGAQTHLFEDRVMKIGTVAIGDRVSIGSRSIVLYNSNIQDDVTIKSLSLIMKGESLQANTQWVGSPVSES